MEAGVHGGDKWEHWLCVTRVSKRNSKAEPFLRGPGLKLWRYLKMEIPLCCHTALVQHQQHFRPIIRAQEIDILERQREEKGPAEEGFLLKLSP